ncbi:YhcN/YlaJ family sporulation lipoprotein [Aneurinibacillus soli]|uniref:Sporulation lipoprotein YhcN/YlaJ n=1 Tax=Aneurinibacillus soli TaxID=1500254 RepID=A0A0U5BCJ7_9BACL|nr:YhcN/YlaJ family sporulation lipoprotein [Aneurinibacillus soli]PYE59665.1 YhcN/YlaJ family sporulation lipoprotein [Aneurinibacillus soli]BAU29334.1 sporulation lipoprotein YhcN/YlaJ [Aneurinibacillus soli]
MNKRTAVLSALLILSLAGGVVGCGKQDGNTQKTQSYRSNEYHMNGSQNYAPRSNAIREDEQRIAKRIAQQAANVDGVTRATAVVHGEDVLVGVEGAKASNVKMLERSVHEALRRTEPGYRIHVTADHTLSTRIRMISQDINGSVGNKMRTAGSDIASLIRDIGNSVTAPFR